LSYDKFFSFRCLHLCIIKITIKKYKMKKAQEFMLMFRFEPTNVEPTAEQMQLMHNQWGEFITNIAMQGQLVSTYQLGYEGMQISSDQSTQEGIMVSGGQTLSGNMVLLADSMAEAVKLARKCPILLMGGGVEVRSIIPMN
jgi:hypothetical protein